MVQFLYLEVALINSKRSINMKLTFLVGRRGLDVCAGNGCEVEVRCCVRCRCRCWGEKGGRWRRYWRSVAKVAGKKINKFSARGRSGDLQFSLRHIDQLIVPKWPFAWSSYHTFVNVRKRIHRCTEANFDSVEACQLCV